MIGLNTLIMPTIIGLKFGFDYLVKEWQERGRRRKQKTIEMRRKYLNMSLHNMKTVKLYAWQNTFCD